MAELRFSLPKPKVSGRVTLGPVPGTPEFDFEQRCRRAGLRYVPPQDAARASLELALIDVPPDTQPSGK
jgi:hypothetical protein